MVIFIKRKRRMSNSEINHIRVDSDGRLHVGGIYAGFDDDSFKIRAPSPSPDSKKLYVPRGKVCVVKVINQVPNHTCNFAILYVLIVYQT